MLGYEGWMLHYCCETCTDTDEPRYVIADRGSSCPDGYSVIDSQSQCRSACLDLGWEKDNHGPRWTQSNYPFGCIENTLYCYFNGDTTDSNSNQRSRVCALPETESLQQQQSRVLSLDMMKTSSVGMILNGLAVLGVLSILRLVFRSQNHFKPVQTEEEV